MTKAERIHCLYLLVYNVDKPTNTMEYQCCVLIYPIGKPCNNPLNNFIAPQVIILLALVLSSNNTSA